VQLREIARLTRGEVVGINIGSAFPSEAAKATAGSRVALVNMSGTSLDFDDDSFDMVISANVLEHVPEPLAFIREAHRVTRASGICYMETAPVWTSAKGHHVMKCMVAENCPWEERFCDNGSIIPDWSHLSHSRVEMEREIGDKVDPRTREWILQYLYDSNDLNKVPWRMVRKAFTDLFPFPRIQENKLAATQDFLMPEDDLDNYSVCGFNAICRKRRQSPISKRVYWRLRRLGL